MSLGIKSFVYHLETSTLLLPPVRQPWITGNQVLLAFQRLAEIDAQQLRPHFRLQKVVEVLSETLGVPIAIIEFYSPTLNTLEYEVGTVCLLSTDDTSTPKLRGMLPNPVILSRVPTFDTDAQGITIDNSLCGYLPTSSMLKTLIQLPLISDQTVLGVLSLASPEPFPDLQAFRPWGQNLASYVARLVQSHQLATQLKSVQQQFELVAASVNGFFYDWNVQSDQVQRFSDPTHQEPEQSLAPILEAWLAEIHPDDRPAVEALIEQDFQGQDDFEIEYRVQGKEQLAIPMCDRGLILRDQHGHITRIVGIVQDITEQKQTEQAAQQQAAEYQTLLADIKVIVFQTDRSGNWTYLNPAWTELTGYTLPESLRKPFSDFVHPDDRQGYWQAFQNLVDGTSETYHHEVRYLTKQGRCCWFEVHRQVLLAEDGSITGTAGTLVDATERKQTERALLHDALHDGLTDLPNRVLFMDRLQQACRSFQRHRDEIFAVLFLDLDRFKIINDTLGHMVGDQLLVAVGHRLQTCLRPEDTVARLGGDEFTVLLTNIERVEDAIQVSNRILQTLSTSFTLNNTEVFISTSIGIAMCSNPEHRPEDLLRHADIALYRAKSSGKACYAVFSSDMPIQPLAQVQIGTELRQALEDDEFRLYCYPILRLETQELWGFTLQMYWQHPSKGVLPPTEFIHSVTDVGLLKSMSWWLFRKACQQLHHWQRTAINTPLTICIAVTKQQLASSNFISKFERIIAKEEIEPHHLVLELPELEWSQLPDSILTHLQQLRSQGVQLAYIQHDQDYDWLTPTLPVAIDWIKLSPMLLGNLEQKGCVESVHSLFSLADSLGIRIIADGIHTPKQHMLMNALKCDYGQGGHFTAALPIHAADPWLEPSFSQPFDSMTSSSSMSLLIIYSPIGQSQVPLVGQKTWTIGRSPDNSIVLPDRWASRNHAQLRMTEAGEVYLIDLGSGNGSVVNGERVTLPVSLQDGDLITIGHSQLEFHHRNDDSALSSIETAPKNVLMVQASHLQGQVWKEALSSQGISLTWLNENIDLAQYLTKAMKSGKGLPDLLLLDMTVLKPNPYSFCRWCHNLQPDLKIILTSGTRTFVPASERKWATHQGASELISAFDEGSIFSNVIDVMAKVRIVLTALKWRPIAQGSLSSALLAIKPSLSTSTFSSNQTIIGELPADLELN